MKKSGGLQIGVTYGNALLYRALIWLLKHFRIQSLYIFMSICVIPVAMVMSPGARIAYRYFRIYLSMGRWQAIKATYKNHCLFGQTVIDRFAVYAGHKFNFQYNGLDYYQKLLANPKPFVQLSAHIGCSEILGYSMHLDKPCNVLVFGGENPQLMHYRQASFSNMNMKMIPVGNGTFHYEIISSAFNRGEIVSAFADRYVNAEKIIVSNFQDHDIKLARGPFSLAVTRGLDVVMVSAMKEIDGSYSAYFTPLSYDQSLSKGEQRQQLANAYTAEIERLLEMYPYQWFNYFDLWE